MEKKLYEAADAELIRLAAQDVLTMSDGIGEETTEDEPQYSKPY